MVTTKPILSIQNLTVEYSTPAGPLRAVDNVDISVMPGETVAVVGESGCGKTTLARAVLGLQPTVSGTMELNGEVIRGASSDQATRIGMVWQDPFASIDPQWTIRRIVNEPAAIAGESIDVDQLLVDVGLNAEFGRRYPHQLSGGQRQRAAIARALALRPPLVICDEPTAALDLSVQAQILNLLKDIQDARGCSFLYISHDLTTVRYLANRVAVMYLGQIVEQGPVEDVFNSPLHPYSRSLLDSAPSLDRLGVLPEPARGEVPDASQLPAGCRFATRCERVTAECWTSSPPVVGSELHQAICFHPLT